MEKKKASIGCLFWVALILLVIVVVLFNLKQIGEVAKTTGIDKFFNSLFTKGESGKKTTQTEKQPDAKVQAPQQQDEKGIAIKVDEDNTPAPQPQKTPEKTATAVKTKEKPLVEVHNEPTAAARVSQDDKNPNLRNANLFFTKVNADGKITSVPAKRAVRYSDSPLKATVIALLQGPNSQEIGSGLSNMIPEKTELKNVYVRGNTAYLDFNENFRFNTQGKEGMTAQLQQLVYTCTEFINVQNVQILIDGKVVDYLGAEGVYIGQPLARDDF